MKTKTFITALLATIISTSCTTPTPTPTQVATSLPTTTSGQPTVTLTATPTIPTIEVDGLQIPDPKVINPELFDVNNPDLPIVQFANAFGIKQEDVARRIVYEKRTDNAEKQYVIALYDLNPDPSKEGEPLENAIVFIGKRDEGGNWNWYNGDDISNGALFGDEFMIGTVLQPHLASRDIQTNEFNAATITYTWQRREPTQGQRDTTYVENQLQLAMTGPIPRTIRLSHIISSDSEPDWLRNVQTDEELETILRNQVRFVIETYSARGVTEFNVLNEPYPQYSYLAGRLGRDHLVTLVFEEANKVRDDIINEANKNNREIPVIRLGFSNSENHFAGGIGTSPTSEILKMLAETGWIDYVDVHFHIKDISKMPTPEDVADTLSKYGDIINSKTGKPIEVVVGEMDLNISRFPLTDSSRLYEQGALGYSYFQAILKAGVREITFWGAVDSDS